MSTPTIVIEMIQVIIPVFCVATMFALGLDVTLAEIRAPFRNKLALAIIVLAGNIIIPLLAVVILAAPSMLPGKLPETIKDLITLTPEGQIGFLLVALAAGSIVGPTLVGIAKGNVALAKGATLLLILATAILMPIEIGLLRQSPFLGATAVSAWSIFNTLLLFQLLPLAIGVLIKSRYDALAAHLRPLISQLANLVLLVMLMLLPATGQGPITWPPKFPAVETPVVWKPLKYASTLIAALDGSSNGMIGKERAEQFNNSVSHTLLISTTAQISQQDGQHWKVTYDEKVYTVVSGTNTITVSAVMPYWFSVKPATEDLGEITTESTILTDTLKPAFADHKVTFSKDLEITKITEGLWRFRDQGAIYAVKKMDQSLNVYSQTLQQSGIVADLLQFVFKPQTVATVIDFAKNLGIVVAPFVAYGVVALLLLTIGYYAGVLINNATGVDALAVARTQALSATVRNVVAALLVASRDFYPPSERPEDFSAIAVILVFYTVGLIVAAIQADRWSRQPEIAPAPPAGQPQATTFAPAA